MRTVAQRQMQASAPCVRGNGKMAAREVELAQRHVERAEFQQRIASAALVEQMGAFEIGGRNQIRRYDSALGRASSLRKFD